LKQLCFIWGKNMISYSKLRGRIFGKKAKTIASLIYNFHQKNSLKREISFLESKFIIKNIINSLKSLHKLKYFEYLNEFDDITNFLVEVKRNKVDIGKLEFEEIKKNELKYILEEYNNFLKNNKLADIADMEKFVLQNIDEKHTVDKFVDGNIHFFDSVLQKEIYERIKDNVLEERLPDKKTKIITIECFDEFDEAVKVFKLIRELIDKRENIENIKIFTTNIDNYFKIFETLSFEYKIPVYSTKGLEVKRYKKGRDYAKQKAKFLKRKFKKFGIDVDRKELEKEILNERFLVKNGIEITETNQIYLYKNIKHLFLVGTNIENFPPSRNINIFYVKDYESIFFKNSLFETSRSILNRMQRIADNIIATHQKDNLSILIDKNPIERKFKFNSIKDKIISNYKNVPFDLKRGSVSQINTYTKCPKQYFFKYVLKLKSPQEELSDMDVMLKGKIMHSAFEIAIKENINDIEVLIQKSYKDEEIQNELTGSIFEELYKVELRKILENFLKYIKTINTNNSKVEYKIFLNEHLEIINEEKYQQNDPQEYFFKGIIDRLDIEEEQIKVVDYKSSNSKNYSEFKVQNKNEKIKDIQLGLYTYWAKHKFNKPVNASLITFKKEIDEFVNMRECDGDELKERNKTIAICYNPAYEEKLKNHIFNTVTKIKNGEFDYIDEPDCDYCDYRKICKKV